MFFFLVFFYRLNAENRYLIFTLNSDPYQHHHHLRLLLLHISFHQQEVLGLLALNLARTNTNTDDIVDSRYFIQVQLV